MTTGFHSPAIGDGGATTRPEKLTSHETESFVGSGAFNNDVPGHPGVKQQQAYPTLYLSLRFEPRDKAYTAELFVNNATDREVKYDAAEVCTQVGAPCQPTRQIWAAYWQRCGAFFALLRLVT
nr:hypothetical protein [uncultured Duganella sp.]